MDLTFTNNGEAFVAEFEATGDFNLHIEKPDGWIVIYQRTAGNGWDRIRGIRDLEYNRVIDYDFTALVYPKSIKIECEVEPTLAVVTLA